MSYADTLPSVVDVTKLRAHYSKVLVRRKPQDGETKGHFGKSIALPERYEKHLWVQVVNVGNGYLHDETGIRIPSTRAQRGDWCICRQFEGHQFQKWLAPDGWEYSLVEGQALECRVRHGYLPPKEAEAAQEGPTS